MMQEKKKKKKKTEKKNEKMIKHLQEKQTTYRLIREMSGRVNL